jgi:hypothetical protein
MFCIVSRRSRQRNLHAIRMHKVSVRSFASTVDEPCFSKSAMSCRILRGTSTLASKKQLQSNAELQKKSVSERAPLQRTRSDGQAFKPARPLAKTSGLGCSTFGVGCFTLKVIVRVYSCSFVVSRTKRNSGPKEPSCREQRDRRQSR